MGQIDERTYRQGRYYMPLPPTENGGGIIKTNQSLLLEIDLSKQLW